MYSFTSAAVAATETTETFDVAELLNRLPHGTVINEEMPTMPQEMRDRLLVIIDQSIGQIRSNLYKKERKITRSFDRSSLKIWEYSPHQRLANSLEYLHGQMNDLQEFVKRGSWVGVMLLAPVIRENWTISFKRVDQELLEPRYNWRNERQKAWAKRQVINAWKQRQGSGQSR
jgi:hypothetical protein